MAKIKVEKVQQLEGHRDSIYSLIPIEKSSQFISAGGDGLLVLWDIEQSNDGQLLAKVPNSVYAIAFDEAKNQLVVGHNFEGIHIIDITTKKEITSKKLINSTIFDIQLTEKYIFVAFNTGQVQVLDKETLTIVHEIIFSTQSARCLAVSLEKNELAIGYSDACIRIIDLTTFKLKKELKEHTKSVFSLVYSPNNLHLLSVGRDANLKIWNIENDYAMEKSIVAHMYTINHLTYSPDGCYFATCSMDKSIKIWDATTFQLLKVIDKARHAGHGTSINKLYWNEHHLISCSDDRTISVWKIEF